MSAASNLVFCVTVFLALIPSPTPERTMPTGVTVVLQVPVCAIARVCACVCVRARACVLACVHVCAYTWVWIHACDHVYFRVYVWHSSPQTCTSPVWTESQRNTRTCCLAAEVLSDLTRTTTPAVYEQAVDIGNSVATGR